MHHLIFEGAELSGKSWIMSQVYNYLEPKYNQSESVLDGCHWFNADVGVFGTELGKNVIKNYSRIFTVLKEKNIIVEKLHISDFVYNQIYNNKNINYKAQEQKLLALGFKIILIKFKPDKSLLKKRIQDRLNLYPHYKNIQKTPEWYIDQQRKYEKVVESSILPTLSIETDALPDKRHIEKILGWIGE